MDSTFLNLLRRASCSRVTQKQSTPSNCFYHYLLFQCSLWCHTRCIWACTFVRWHFKVIITWLWACIHFISGKITLVLLDKTRVEVMKIRKCLKNYLNSFLPYYLLYKKLASNRVRAQNFIWFSLTETNLAWYLFKVKKFTFRRQFEYEGSYLVN